MHVAYLTNRYPAVSHSFIRREIAAVEAEGIAVSRFSIRPVEISQLPDQADREELAKTLCLLRGNYVPLIASALMAILTKPMHAFKALKIAFVHCEWRPMDVIRRAAYFAEAAFLALRVKRDEITHIHAHFGTNPAAVARIASHLSGVPYSFTVHGPDEFDTPRQLDLQGKVRDCAFCVAISSYGRSQVMRWSAFEHWPKITVVRCGVDERFMEPGQHCEPPIEPHFCAVARLSAQKGIPLLLEAAAELRRRGRHFRITLVGDGEMRSEIEHIITDQGLTGIVELSGWADSAAVVQHLQASRAMVLPSFAEGLPVVIMEALALQRPVIVTAIAGTPELVDSKCGWLISAGSVTDLVSALEQALDTPRDCLEEMGRQGRGRVLEYHNSRRNGQRLAAMFRSGAAYAA